jgi:hypothetical protein
MPDGCCCPVCDTELERFGPGGHNKRSGVKCPICGSNARTRFAWIFLQRETDSDARRIGLKVGTSNRMFHCRPRRPDAARPSIG